MVLGCVLPQNDSVLPVLGVPLNHPPRIAEELMPVSRYISASLDSTCPFPTAGLASTVNEPDLADETHYRYYVDWNPITNNLPVTGGYVLGTGSNVLRTLPPFVVSNAPQALSTVGTHTVELWITDGPADSITSRRPAPFPATVTVDGGPQDQYYVATYAWVVTLAQSCPPP
jgi:hypothetical protein